MKSMLFMVASCLIFSFYNCHNVDRQSTLKPENDIDAARDFIRAALDGKFEQARRYLLPDSLNTDYMDVAERNYQKANPEIKTGYRGSSINVHQVTPVNDSTTIIIYSNSFKNDHDTLKVLKVSGQWLIDLKYLYEHDMNTTQYSNPDKDSLQ